jgi:hypothetical protein
MNFAFSFVLAGLALLGGAIVLWFVSEMIEGKQEFILHFGNVIFVTALGLILFPFWGWASTAIVLGCFAVLWFGGAIVERLRR